VREVSRSGPQAVASLQAVLGGGTGTDRRSGIDCGCVGVGQGQGSLSEGGFLAVMVFSGSSCETTGEQPINSFKTEIFITLTLQEVRRWY